MHFTIFPLPLIVSSILKDVFTPSTTNSVYFLSVIFTSIFEFLKYCPWGMLVFLYLQGWLTYLTDVRRRIELWNAYIWSYSITSLCKKYEIIFRFICKRTHARSVKLMTKWWILRSIIINISVQINSCHFLKKNRPITILILKIHCNLCFRSVFSLDNLVGIWMEAVVSILYSWRFETSCWYW